MNTTEQTKKLQRTEMEILSAIGEACQKLGIDYYIAYGTLLGAVRHQGFIPWDDDIDVWMKREDYEIFIAHGAEYLPKHFFIQHYSTEPNTNNLFAKVRNTHTLFLENDTETVDMNHGIFVDVFPLERVPDDEKAARREHKKRYRFNLINDCYDAAGIKTIILPGKRLFAWAVHVLICLPRNRNKFIRREDERRKRLHERGGDGFLLGFFEYHGAYPWAALDRKKSYPFDGFCFVGPEDADGILAGIYGDYMTLPPVEKRITHAPLKVVFEEEWKDAP